MKTLALISLFAASVSAGKSHNSGNSSSSAAPAAAATAAPIPASISSGCTSFLQSLDSDSKLQTCLSAITSATGSISPTASSSDVNSALGNLCQQSTTDACGEGIFRKQLTSFLASCKDEVAGTNPNTAVQQIYDTLFAFAPFLESVCSKDDSENFCLTTIGKQAASGTSLDTVKSELAIVVQLPLNKRDSSPFSQSGTYLVPNATTFRSAAIPFLFLTPNTPQATLCSTCSENILKPYLDFESSIANALGVPNSPLLGGQKDLWAALQGQCGASFTDGVVANAGADPNGNSTVTVGGSLSGATTIKVSAGGVLAAIIGALVAL